MCYLYTAKFVLSKMDFKKKCPQSSLKGKDNIFGDVICVLYVILQFYLCTGFPTHGFLCRRNIPHLR